MAIGKISGVMLQSNLERQGVPLSFEGNLLYIDVNNTRIGVNTSTPECELDINGTIRANTYIGVSAAITGNVNAGNVVVTGAVIAGNTTVSSINSNGAITGVTGTISGNLTAGNIATRDINTSGLATVSSLQVNNSATIGANLTVTGNTSIDGNLSVSDSRFYIVDDLDPTKIARFQVGNILTGTSRTYSLPDNSSTLVDLDTDQTIAATKTFSAPIQNIGSSTADSTIKLGYGATPVGRSKLVLLGVGGQLESWTEVHIGSNVSGALGSVTINHYTNFSNTVSIAGNVSSGGSASFSGGIQNTAIGNAIPSTGSFTNLTANSVTTITSTEQSTSTSSGALVVSGGTGIGGNLNVGGNLSVSGNLFVSGGDFTNINIGNITFSNTTVTTTLTNGDLIFTPTGDGEVFLTASTTIDGSLTANAISSNSSVSGIDFTFSGNGAVTGTLSSGDLTADGNITATGDITNSGNITATGNLSASNGSFTDSLSVSNTTTITSTQFLMDAITPSTDYTTGAVVVSGGVGIGGNLNVNGGITTSNLVVNGGDLTNVNLGNLTFSNTIISTKLLEGNITLQPTGNGLVYIEASTAVLLPKGDTSQQPVNAPIGAIRYNTEIESPEFWNGDFWIPTTTSIDSEIITPDGVSKTFALTRNATTAGVIVSLNGVLQLAGVAYVVSGNQITFTEIPQTTDIVDIRYIATGSVVPVHEEQSFFVRNVGFNASPNTRYAVDTTAAPVTVMLTSTPSLGDAVYFADAGGAYTTNNLYVDPNGLTIMGVSGPMTVDTNDVSFGLFWNGTTWKQY